MKLINHLKNDVCLRYIQKFITQLSKSLGHGVVHWVEALRYEPESRGLYSRWGNWNFSLAVALM